MPSALARRSRAECVSTDAVDAPPTDTVITDGGGADRCLIPSSWTARRMHARSSHLVHRELAGGVFQKGELRAPRNAGRGRQRPSLCAGEWENEEEQAETALPPQGDRPR